MQSARAEGYGKPPRFGQKQAGQGRGASLGEDFWRGRGPTRAQIAQLVEHATENRSVAGSIPALGTIFP